VTDYKVTMIHHRKRAEIASVCTAARSKKKLMKDRPMGRHKGSQIRHGDLLKVQDTRAPHLLDLKG
jgi:hypothetical protein